MDSNLLRIYKAVYTGDSISRLFRNKLGDFHRDRSAVCRWFYGKWYFLAAKLEFTVFVQKLPRGCVIDCSATWLRWIACKSPTLYSRDLGVQPNRHLFACQIRWNNRRRKLTLQHYFSFHLQLNCTFLTINWNMANRFFLFLNWKAKNKTNTCSFFFFFSYEAGNPWNC